MSDNEKAVSCYERLAGETEKAVQAGYTPPGLPGCAYLVSAMMKRAGWNIPNYGYTLDLVPLGDKVSQPQRGDIVFFKQTYDAVAPAGIGPEDDKTHVGIMVSKGKFAHFSSGQKAPVYGFITDEYWQTHLECFIRPKPPAGEIAPTTATATTTPAQDKTGSVKVFYHPAVERPKIIVDGREDVIDEMFLTARTRGGNEICITSHPFETAPCLRLNQSNKQNVKIKSMDWTAKYE